MKWKCDVCGAVIVGRAHRKTYHRATHKPWTAIAKKWPRAAGRVKPRSD